MPLERHWERQNTPLRGLLPRERRIALLVGLVAALVAAGVLVAALATGGVAGAKPGCVQVTAAGNTGGYVLRSCGADAQSFCRQEAGRADAFARSVALACRERHIPGS